MIVQIPTDNEQKNIPTCVLCGKPTALEDATAGLLYADGHQAFAIVPTCKVGQSGLSVGPCLLQPSDTNYLSKVRHPRIRMRWAMHQLFIEQRQQSGGGISGDLTKHLYGRLLRGKVVVVCDHPQPFMSAVRKQWLKVCRQVQREQASTLDATKILELIHLLSRMQSMRFSAKPPLEEVDADVSFATVEQLLVWAPVCHTMYVTCEITREQLHLITAWMPRGGLLVIY